MKSNKIKIHFEPIKVCQRFVLILNLIVILILILVQANCHSSSLVLIDMQVNVQPTATCQSKSAALSHTHPPPPLVHGLSLLILPEYTSLCPCRSAVCWHTYLAKNIQSRRLYSCDSCPFIW